MVDDALLTHLGQPARQTVGRGDGQRHQLRGLVGGVAEHQALVSGTGLVDVLVLVVGGTAADLVGRVDTVTDLLRLLADGDVHPAGAAVEADGGRGETDAQQCLTDQLGDFDVGVAADLTGHVDLTGGDHGLHGDVRTRILPAAARRGWCRR